MFKKYNSIENTYREEFLDRIRSHGFWEEEYVVQEKVHGANLSYYSTDGINFKSAKRTEGLKADEKFYNHDKILADIQPKLINIWKLLQKEMKEVNQVNFYGEVIGGDYPHADIKQDSQSIKVQKGIYYSPQNHFFAFDILVNQEIYLEVEKANGLFEQEGLLYAKTLFKGKFEDCLAYPNNFESTVPAELGLPELKPNIVEGVVIRPLTPRYFRNGTRVILKNKNEKWSENKKYHGKINKQAPLPEKVVQLQEVILTYVTDNRLNNVLSKMGEVTRKDFGRILGMFSKDVVEDFLKDYKSHTDELEKKELKLVVKSFARTAAGMINRRLANM